MDLRRKSVFFFVASLNAMSKSDFASRQKNEGNFKICDMLQKVLFLKAAS